MIHATSQITLALNAIKGGFYEASGSFKLRNFNLGLTSAHRRLKHQDKTFYTSFASTLISRFTLESGVDSDNLDQDEESIIILFNNAFIIIYGQFNLLLHNL